MRLEGTDNQLDSVEGRVQETKRLAFDGMSSLAAAQLAVLFATSLEAQFSRARENHCENAVTRSWTVDSGLMLGQLFAYVLGLSEPCRRKGFFEDGILAKTVPDHLRETDKSVFIRPLNETSQRQSGRCDMQKSKSKTSLRLDATSFRKTVERICIPSRMNSRKADRGEACTKVSSAKVTQACQKRAKIGSVCFCFSRKASPIPRSTSDLLENSFGSAAGPIDSRARNCLAAIPIGHVHLDHVFSPVSIVAKPCVCTVITSVNCARGGDRAVYDPTGLLIANSTVDCEKVCTTIENSSVY
ncbi:uncharacterized protein LOC143185102 [Calliopsis andreniformis]|uniref:uncharacterized protein LOC143185102 n=1 Tax=Calliopsis andreniformis TaxID=337506 RepID=UPI003FCDEA5E